uniref:Uncharacterized protein n=1 Tax=Cacopsylla melanoneura TaxID=428564 RepID=A0A8D9E820_9HEMI
MIRQTEVKDYLKTRASELKRQLSRSTAERAISGRRLNERNNESPTYQSSRREVEKRNNLKEEDKTSLKELKFENDKRELLILDETNDEKINPSDKAKNVISTVNRVETVKTSKNIKGIQKTQNDIRMHKNDAINDIQNKDGAKDSVKVVFRNKIEHQDESVEIINATPLKSTRITNITPRKQEPSQRRKSGLRSDKSKQR